ncbi:MAG: hypothetical protein JJ992_29935, partial [Planctomycetes bacterium]|nr:hypothetical protein [Planctomycetota bacterium]
LQEIRPLKFADLHVQPDEPAKFEAASCELLLAKIESLGAKHIDDLQNIAVSLEDFFEGNHCKPSIAANVDPPPPFDTIESWYEQLRAIRSREDVQNVVVAISMIEPYEDGRVGMWPYADTIWICSALDREAVAELVKPLDPDAVDDLSDVNDPEWSVKPPFSAPDGFRSYRVWWD